MSLVDRITKRLGRRPNWDELWSSPECIAEFAACFEEQLMYDRDTKKIQVLDHGYVEFIEAWGTGRAGITVVGNDPNDPDPEYKSDYEVGIIEAARQSTQKGFLGWENDDKLLMYLYEHKHSTPFEFAGMVLEVQAPIFVFREWHRHRTQSYNEMSARYAPLPDLYYEPADVEVVQRAQAGVKSANKQAQAAAEVNPHAISTWVHRGYEINELLEQHYKQGLAIGVPKELARIQMPVGHYSRMRVHVSLRNWLAFMTLRCDPNAQWEIRQFAWAVAGMVQRTFPQTHALWADWMNKIHP